MAVLSNPKERILGQENSERSGMYAGHVAQTAVNFKYAEAVLACNLLLEGSIRA